MHRTIWGLAGIAVALSLVSGCCNPNRQGLLARMRARSAMPEQNPCQPCNNSVEIPVVGPGMPGAVPMMPGAPGNCPCQTIPGTVTEGTPELIMPQPRMDGTTQPPLRPMPAPPGSATPNPAGPSGEPAGLRKNGPTVYTKSLISP